MSTTMSTKLVSDWTPTDVSAWLSLNKRKLDSAEALRVYVHNDQLDGKTLLEFTEQDGSRFEPVIDSRDFARILKRLKKEDEKLQEKDKKLKRKKLKPKGTLREKEDSGMDDSSPIEGRRRVIADNDGDSLSSASTSGTGTFCNSGGSLHQHTPFNMVQPAYDYETRESGMVEEAVYNAPEEDLLPPPPPMQPSSQHPSRNPPLPAPAQQYVPGMEEDPEALYENYEPEQPPAPPGLRESIGEWDDPEATYMNQEDGEDMYLNIVDQETSSEEECSEEEDIPARPALVAPPGEHSAPRRPLHPPTFPDMPAPPNDYPTRSQMGIQTPPPRRPVPEGEKHIEKQFNLKQVEKQMSQGTGEGPRRGSAPPAQGLQRQNTAPEVSGDGTMSIRDRIKLMSLANESGSLEEMPVAPVSSIKSRAAMLGGIFGGASPKPEVKKSPVSPEKPTKSKPSLPISTKPSSVPPPVPKSAPVFSPPPRSIITPPPPGIGSLPRPTISSLPRPAISPPQRPGNAPSPPSRHSAPPTSATTPLSASRSPASNMYPPPPPLTGLPPPLSKTSNSNTNLSINSGYQDVDIEQPCPGRNPLPRPNQVSLPSLANVLQVDDSDLYQLEPDEDVYNDEEPIPGYQPHITDRREAERVLTNDPRHSCYLVRDSGSQADFPHVISVKNNGYFEHTRIGTRHNGRVAIGTAKPGENTYPSLRDLILFHATSPMALRGRNILLQYPVKL